jgi:hypothetical protein
LNLAEKGNRLDTASLCGRHCFANDFWQRASSTAAGPDAASSPFYLTLTASLATAAAAGSAAWYYHLYGQEAFAMTPAEEG